MSRFKNWQSPIFDGNGWAFEKNISIDAGFYGYKSNFGRPFGWRCQYPESLKLGEGSDIGCFSYMNGKYGIEIGKSTQIGAHCSIYSHDSENDTKGRVIIGDNCLIGSYTLILPNSVIPPNSKIKARSTIRYNEDCKNTEILDHKYGYGIWRKLE